MNSLSPLPPRFEDFEFAMPHLPQKYPLAYAPSHGPYEESTLSDLSTRMNTFLSEMDTQIVIPRPTHTGRAPSLDEADFDAAAVLSRAPSRAPTPAASPQPEKPQPKKKSKVTLTADQKRLNHLESEKKRRDNIKESFKQLVELVSKGEVESGISPFGDEASEAEEINANGKRKKKSATKKGGQGRGRRGEVFSGATKNRFIGQAILYVEWLKNDTARMQAEVEAMEAGLS